jgi:hypothetical protein
MSTYYAVVCDKHMERTDAASRSGGGIGNVDLCDSKHTLKPFLVAHQGCPLRCISEHQDEYYDTTYQDWTELNVYDMASKHRDT